MGTAAVVSQIDTIGYHGENFSIPVLADGKAMEIKRLLNDIRLGRSEDSYGWMIDLPVGEIA